MNDKVNFPANALPLDPETLDKVKQFDSKALYWLSGYCSGLADAKGVSGEALTQVSAEQSYTPQLALKTADAWHQTVLK